MTNHDQAINHIELNKTYTVTHNGKNIRATLIMFGGSMSEGELTYWQTEDGQGFFNPTHVDLTSETE